MARYSGLLTSGASNVDAVLDALWAFFDGNTAGGWTWAREGTTEAIYGYKDFGSGGTAVRRVVWLCGDTAGSTPGLLALDTAAANRLFIGAGRIAAGSFAWAGWKDAAPMGSGGIGRVHVIASTDLGAAAKSEIFIADSGIFGRLEGSSTTDARMFRMGAVCEARSAARGGAATGDPDGLRTGMWLRSRSGAVAADWLSAGTYGEHSASNGATHGWVTVSGVVTTAQTRIANRLGTDAIVSGGKVIVTPCVWQDSSSGLDYGFDLGVCGGQTYASATKVLSLSGIEMAYAWCRDSSGTSTEAVIVSAATLTP